MVPQDPQPAYFRDLVTSETSRLTGLCQTWEEKLDQKIPEEIQGSIRSVIGQGRLVMAERFAQFSGLVDNCEFKRGEKETTTMDLLGFWEMIYYQVQDVDEKFSQLSLSEVNNWEDKSEKSDNIDLKTIHRKDHTKKIIREGKLNKPPVQRSNTGLKALIAAKRAALGKQAKTPVKDVVSNESADSEEKKDSQPTEDREFDGGFFKISSPCASSLSTGGGKRKVVERTGAGGSVGVGPKGSAGSRSAKSEKRIGGLLSPYVSNMAKRMVPGASPRKDARGALAFNEDELDVEVGQPKYNLRPTPQRVQKLHRVTTPSAS